MSYLETYRLNELLAHRVANVSELPSNADKAAVAPYRRAGIEFVLLFAVGRRCDGRDCSQPVCRPFVCFFLF